MYKYLLNDDMTKFAMMNDDEVICEANVVVEDDFAVLNFFYGGFVWFAHGIILL